MIEYQPTTSIATAKVISIRVTEEGPTWMDPIWAFLKNDKLPDNRTEARRLKLRASRYVLLDGILYKRSLTLLYLQCLTLTELKLAMREIHKGVCGNHSGGISMVHRLIRADYYWSTMGIDYARFS